MKKIITLFAALCGFYGATAQITPAQNARLRSNLPFAGQTCANIAGHAINGREYALVGASKGLAIVDVTAPDAPSLVRQIPGTDNLWKEVKTYKNYAYVTTEGAGQGLQIIDMTRLPDSVRYKSYFGGDSILQNINNIHALHVDTAKGFVYLFGGSSRLTTGVNVTGAVVLDIKTDPWNPKFVGHYNTRYIHDGYVNNDTLYASHIYQGFFSIVDFRDKTNPITINTQNTPTNFTHNTWLSVNQKTVFTTDENASSYLASYDISNPQNIRLLDRVQSPVGGAAIVHNTHILNDFAITSWYTEGVVIHDVHRPQNMVQVAQYDTYGGASGGFNGTWGVYPYLPSGNLVLSNIENGLYVVSADYLRACYLEGLAIDSVTRQPLAGVKVKINSNDPDKGALSNVRGEYYTGQVTPGTFSVTFTKAGYYPKTVSLSLARAVVNNYTAELKPIQTTRLVINSRQANNANLDSVTVVLKNDNGTYNVKTNVNGTFTIDNVYEGNYEVWIGKWGYLHQKTTKSVVIGNNNILDVTLTEGYQDDFWGDFNWQIGGDIPAAAQNAGRWVRGVPVGTTLNGLTCNVAEDVSDDLGTECFMTGNGGGQGGTDDVDGGTTTLVSPIMKMRRYPQTVNVGLSFSYWFVNTGGTGTPNDTLKVIVSNGLTERTVAVYRENTRNWTRVFIPFNGLGMTLTDSMQIRFAAQDVNPGHVLECAIDKVLQENRTSTTEIATKWQLKAGPNPFNEGINVRYELENKVKNAQLSVYNNLGQLVEIRFLADSEGSIYVGQDWPTGLYLLQIEASGQVSQRIKVLKQ